MPNISKVNKAVKKDKKKKDAEGRPEKKLEKQQFRACR